MRRNRWPESIINRHRMRVTKKRRYSNEQHLRTCCSLEWAGNLFEIMVNAVSHVRAQNKRARPKQPPQIGGYHLT